MVLGIKKTPSKKEIYPHRFIYLPLQNTINIKLSLSHKYIK